MSSKLCGLLSATFHEPGYTHHVELVHQRDPVARRRLAALRLSVYEPQGELLREIDLEPTLETLDLAGLLGDLEGLHPRLMVAFDARYDERVFPYRPHHYAYLHRRESTLPPLYYAVTAALGGVPDRIDNTRINNFETYIFRQHGAGETFSIIMGNLSRFSTADAQIFLYHGADRRTSMTITLHPKQHAELTLPVETDGKRLARVEMKTPFRLANYVVGRETESRTRVLFDHLFTYFR
jgi:hypothetical protein